METENGSMFQAGDHVYPLDLPKRYLCRVVSTEEWKVHGKACQVLKLQPLEGPWPKGTLLVRADKNVERSKEGPVMVRQQRGWLLSAFAR
jgi:hypothetical protein